MHFLFLGSSLTLLGEYISFYARDEIASEQDVAGQFAVREGVFKADTCSLITLLMWTRSTKRIGNCARPLIAKGIPASL